MRSILNAIAAFIRAMPRFVMQRVQVAGRWISRLVAVPAAYEPEPAAPAMVQHNADLEHAAAVRTAAAHIAAGQVPPHAAVEHLVEIDFEWLAAMPRDMLCKLVGAPDVDLLAHIRGKRPLRGVLARDKSAVEEFRAATRRERNERELKFDLEPNIA